MPHTGWTWLVRVSGDAVEARDKSVAVPVLEAELYHLTRDHDGDRAKFLERRRDEALDAATAALRPHAAGARQAIVLGKSPPLPALDKIVASHAMIHTAEGELWRALFAEALAACGVRVVRSTADALKPDTRWLAAAGKQLGSPWTAEVKAAALAARQCAHHRLQ